MKSSRHSRANNGIETQLVALPRPRSAYRFSIAEVKYAVFFALLLVFSSCSVTFLAAYDEVTDRAITDLTVRTEAFLARYAGVTDNSGRIVRSGKSYDAEAAAFYDQSCGAVAAILLRSGEKANNTEEVNILHRLDERYRKLQESHRLGPITQDSAAALHRSLRALTHIQLTKKHIGTTQQTAAEPASTSGT